MKNSDAVKTWEVDGLTVRLFQDMNPSDPRENEDPATMVCWHRRYTLGDKREDWAEPWNDPGEFLAWAKRTRTAFMVLYLYDHSGLSMSCRSFVGRAHHGDWDSGPVGFIYWDKAKAEKLGCVRWSKARKERDMTAQVETYDQYPRGEVYGYTVEDADGEELDACWGFFGDKYAEEEATSAAKSCAENKRKRDEVERIAADVAAVKLNRLYGSQWAD